MVIKLGKHRFSVNSQQLDLTTVLQDGKMCLHLTGTKFIEPITDEQLLATRDVWDQEVVSENRDVYRAEYLAYQILVALDKGRAGPALTEAAETAESPTKDRNGQLTAEEVLAYDDAQMLAFVQRFMGPRYNEAYSKGVHDHDAALILRALLEMKTTIGLLRFHTRARAMAKVYWRHFGDKKHKTLVAAKLNGFGSVAQLFPDATAQSQYVAELKCMLRQFIDATELFPNSLIDGAAEYLFCELTGGGEFVVSRRAADLHEGFQIHLRQNSFTEPFTRSVKAVNRDPASALLLARDWVEAYVEHRPDTNDEDLEYVDEVAELLLKGKSDEHVVDGHVSRDIAGMVGTHPAVAGDTYQLNYNRFAFKMEQFETNIVPRYRQYVELKKEVVDRGREDMRLDEFRPRVLTSFVRNKLIDEVYLPLVGDNLAKQLGVVGEQKRTDRMGLLLLISPPGYGKTTLMEYIANRLGIIFMKINGPAIGHQVTSLDPDEAPNAAAREEVQKLNLSLEMGDNVMIYVDDIQHCNSEFLQKFISLCDAQRKIEGVYKGRTRTYDLRGRKVCVVMAGNPYTESGEKFQIPDMLSNRADIYNLGDIIGETRDTFEMSYLENCITSNPTLNNLASRSHKDVYAIIKMAEQENQEGIDLEGNYSLEEIDEMVRTMKKLMRVRDVVLRVNQQYIRSAAQADEYRTEPPFLLQGSYRNMNRIAEKIVPIMNDHELETLILSNYEQDSQTLTSDAESNMLKLKEMLDILSEDEAKRWASIKRTFGQNVKMKGIDADDQVGQVILQLRDFGEGLNAIREAMAEGVKHFSERDTEQTDVRLTALMHQVGGLRASLEGIGEAVKEAAVQSGGKPVEIAAPPKLPSQKVIVQHKVPQSVLDVVKGQFEVMNKWMEPLLSASTAQSQDLKNLHNSVQTCLANYYALLQELEDAKSKRSAR
jgi:hypothetical protein